MQGQEWKLHQYIGLNGYLLCCIIQWSRSQVQLISTTVTIAYPPPQPTTSTIFIDGSLEGFATPDYKPLTTLHNCYSCYLCIGLCWMFPPGLCVLFCTWCLATLSMSWLV